MEGVKGVLGCGCSDVRGRRLRLLKLEEKELTHALLPLQPSMQPICNLERPADDVHMDGGKAGEVLVARLVSKDLDGVCERDGETAELLSGFAESADA